MLGVQESLKLEFVQNAKVPIGIERKRQRDRKRYHQRRKNGLCTKCNKPSKTTRCDIHKDKRRGRKRRNCPIKGKMTRELLKKTVFNNYGGKCQCCGENNILFLTIDHINGNGRKHLEQIKTKHIYSWLRRNNYPKGFQVLCYNCNSGKYLNGGICPHQQQKRQG